MYMTLENYCRMRYGLGEKEMPTKAQRNTVSQMCRDGALRKQAVKSGKRWLIRTEV